MIPIGDINPRHRFPLVTVLLIGVNLIVFTYELLLGDRELAQFFNTWGVVPVQLMADPIGRAPTVFTAMFLHGGWLHLLGNMLYLWVFGDNIEDRLGHTRFLLFYLVCGVAATALQVALTVNSSIPLIGASGAIAGVLGAYLLLFPLARVTTLVPIVIFFYRLELPAVLVLAFWFVIQLFNGAASLGVSPTTADTGGVAFFAHIGGFVAGFLLVRLFGASRPSRTW